MRKTEEIKDNFKAIERHYLKKDIEPIEAFIQCCSILAELLIDIRTNQAKAYFKQFPEETQNENSAKIREIT